MNYQLRKLATAIALGFPLALTNIAFAQGFEKQMTVPREEGQYEFICKFANTATKPSNSSLDNNVSNRRTIQVQGKDLIITPIYDSSTAPPARTDGSKKRKADLSGLKQFYRMSSSHASSEELYQIAKELESTSQVEYCEFIPKNTPPPADIPPVSADLSFPQSYVWPDPGINVSYARSLGLTGSNVTIADIEYDWNLEHEDLVDQNVRFGNERASVEDSSHGTGVIGILVAGDNGYGITGTVPDAEMIVFTELAGRVRAVTQAIMALSPGDIIILEMQRGGPRTPGSISNTNIPGEESFVPADYDRSLWDIVKIATDAGIHVVATAGNGNVDLDNSLYDNYRARGDNGSIMVGAGSSTAEHNKLSISTYGSPVHLQGWGENVWTLGTGNLVSFGNDVNQDYTHTFGGTSAAAPIVASAVALVQDYAETFLGRDISPREMRTLLIETGITQGEGNWVGPLPNIRAAIERLSEAPSVNICDGVNEYPNWTARDWPGGAYNHANPNDRMVYSGILYSANWYTSSIPGSDQSWLSLGACVAN